MSRCCSRPIPRSAKRRSACTASSRRRVRSTARSIRRSQSQPSFRFAEGENMDWYMAVLKKYAEFSGRARRREYWMFVLINFLIGCGLAVIGALVSNLSFLSWIYSLAVLVPGIAVSVRRLHDTGRSGWWLLIGLIPLIGLIVLIVFFASDGEPGDNEYGPHPEAWGVDAAPAERRRHPLLDGARVPI